MNSYNSFQCLGEITAPCRASVATNGCSVGEFEVVISKQKRKENGAIKNKQFYMNVIFFGKMVDRLCPYLVENANVQLIGELEGDDKPDCNDGYIRMVADKIFVIDGTVNGEIKGFIKKDILM
ncbi:MAG: single-stranded DNA-binding protein [Treponemataceae bacterium]|nr:single-stranded DNA-binding protein [Treponemataceae bacterium]